MNKKRTILGGAILVAVLMLGIGYAAISNIGLEINGRVSADANDANFEVYFQDPVTTSSEGTEDIDVEASVGITDATLNVSGLTAKGDSATAVFTIENGSQDLSANLALKAEEITESDNAGYFSIKTTIQDPTTLESGETTTATVTVTLNKTPIDGAKTGTISVQLEAEPVQPTN